MPPRTVCITQKTWQTFCENFPDAAQWLLLMLNVPQYQLPSLTVSGEPLALALPETQGVFTGEYPGSR